MHVVSVTTVECVIIGLGVVAENNDEAVYEAIGRAQMNPGCEPELGQLQVEIPPKHRAYTPAVLCICLERDPSVIPITPVSVVMAITETIVYALIQVLAIGLS